MDDGTPTAKTCSKCGEHKSFEMFPADRRSRSGRGSQCSECKKKYLAARRAADPDGIRAAQRAYRENNLERAREIARQSRERHREAIAERNREYRTANKEALREARAAYIAANPDAVRESRLRWQRRNREKTREYGAAWRAKNPAAVAAIQHARRARKAATTTSDVDLDALWESQGGLCGLCGGPIDRSLKYPDPMSPSLDHIIPLSRGGPHSQDNLQWAHLIENVRKGARVSPE